LLAGSTNGCTEAILLAHGFPVGLLVKLIDAGLATAHTERMVARPADRGYLRRLHTLRQRRRSLSALASL
jgi:hypothetical protein